MKIPLTLVDASSSSSIRKILLIPSTGEKKRKPDGPRSETYFFYISLYVKYMISRARDPGTDGTGEEGWK